MLDQLHQGRQPSSPLSLLSMIQCLCLQVKEAHYKGLAHYYAALAHDHLATACSKIIPHTHTHFHSKLVSPCIGQDNIQLKNSQLLQDFYEKYTTVCVCVCVCVCPEGGKGVGEELRTEIRFLYAVDSAEAQEAITASHHDYHIGLGQLYIAVISEDLLFFHKHWPLNGNVWLSISLSLLPQSRPT